MSIAGRLTQPKRPYTISQWPALILLKVSSAFDLVSLSADCAALGIILLATLTYFKGSIVDGRVFFEPDTTSYYYPVMSLVNVALKQFTIPLWTPDIFGGYPLFADGEAGMLYPLNLLLWWLLPIQQMFIWSWVIRFFLAGAFTYAYSRSLRLSRLGSLIAGLVFTFGSFNVTQLQHTNVGNSAIWLPLILCFVELGLRAVGPRRWLLVVLAGVALGIQSLGLHIQPVLLTLLLFALYVPFRVWVLDRERYDTWQTEPFANGGLTRQAAGPNKWRDKLNLALAIMILVPAIGLGLAAVQLLPLYELGTFSFRGTGASYSFATSFSLPLQNIATLIWPYLYFRPDGSSWSLWIEWETTVYVGILPLLLAIAGALRRRPLTTFYALVAIFALLMAFGDYLPIKAYWLIWQLPGFASLRVPARFSYLFVFASAVLAAYGWDWLKLAMAAKRIGLSHGKAWLAPSINRLPAVCLGLSATLLAAVFYINQFALADKGAVAKFLQANFLALRHGNPNVTVDNIYEALGITFNPTNVTTLLPIVLLAAIGAILVLWLRFYYQRRLWQALLVVVVVGDLLSFASKFHPTQSWDSIATPSGPVRFLSEQKELQRVYNRYNGLRSEPNRMLPFKVSVFGGYSSLESERTSNFIQAIEQGQNQLLDLANVRYVIGKAGQTPPAQSSHVVYQEGDVVIYRNDSALPRAFVAGSFVLADSDPNSKNSALQKLESNGFDPWQTVVLEEQPTDQETKAGYLAGPSPSSYAIATAGSARLGTPNSWTATTAASDGVRSVKEPAATATVTDYKREGVSVTVDSPRDGFLVLTDSFYPGWTAYIDGQETKIYYADYLFRAVRIRAGQHQIQFVFRPLDFEVGRIISLVTIAIVAATVFALALMSQIAHRGDSRRAAIADRFSDL